MTANPGTAPTDRPWARRGFTLVELLATIVIISVLSGLAVLKSKATIEQARIAKAIGDIRTLQAEVQAYESGGQPLPVNLAAIGRDGLMDPWGRPYEYLAYNPTKPVPPGARRDVFMV
ncbi:MAG: prepilin-type N-terminal cleavage/methylation domain-containing protein, partial [Gemmatimonadales bacterium]